MAKRRAAALQATRSGRKVKRTGTLTEYNQRRDFAKTAEPRGEKAAKSGRRFVVQKHDATRLHYDLRLEHDGVLKSWAITRGPSLVPTDKRLAVQTEDHPMKYLNFEGVIPKGEYGGGTMILWDQGTWSPEFDPDFGLKKGHLHFTLKGKRLKGAWHLVRLRAKQHERHTNWLLIKSDDEEARGPGDTPITEAVDTSIKTKRTNADLERLDSLRADHKARVRVEKARKASLPRITAGKKAIMPGFQEPELADLADRAPKAEGWIHEIKFDGYRMQAHIDGGKVKFFTRKGLDWAKKFEPVVDALKDLRLPTAILDGEVVVEDETGRSNFSSLQKALSENTGEFVYRIFDLLYADGRDLRGVPLVERKEILAKLLSEVPEGGVLRYSDHLEGEGEAFYRHAARLGLEGIISKKAHSLYRSGRRGDWLKVKCTDRQELVVGGWVPSTVASNAVGALVMGLYDAHGKLIHVGRTGTGYTATVARELVRKLRLIERDTSPFANKLERIEAKDVRWVEPRLVAEVELRGFTGDGHIRQASFKGLREDKEPEEVVREKPKGTAAKAGKASAGKARSTERYPLTHPDRVYWPEIGLTKLGLAEFYDAISGYILPHIIGRPLALVRCPSGITQQCFFAKHGWEGMSEHIYTQIVDGDEWIYIKDKDGLIALVQSGVLEIHPWGSMMKTIEKPDRIIMDFDPGPGVGWQAVMEGAIECRDRLKAYGLTSFCKTSGGKGLHVCAPLTPKLGWDQVKDFTFRIASEMAADSPDKYVSNMAKSKRSGRIFVDYLRNGRGSTAVAAYSTRAREGAAVSTPIAWNELGPDMSPTRFTVENLVARLDNIKRDPWAGFFKLKQTIRLKL